MKRVLMMLCLLALPLAAQEAQKKEEPKPEPRIQKLIVLKYVDPGQLIRVLNAFPATINFSQELRAMTVSATPSTMTAVEEAIKQLDVPSAASPNLELVAYFLIGIPAQESSAALPKDLESVVTQLRNTFTYKGFKLMDVLTLRTRAGTKAQTSSSGGAVNIGGMNQPIFTEFVISSSSVGPEGKIRIDGLRTGSRIPVITGPIPPPNSPVNTQFTYQNVGISTDLDIKEGQKVVVGKNSLNNDEALFLVLTARIAQ